MAKHINSKEQRCEKCLEILNFNCGTDEALKSWFIIMQAKNPELHVSCSGRGEDEQNKAFEEGKSKAKWGESPHNYSPSLAIDVFRIDSEGKPSWDSDWIKDTLIYEMPGNIEWGGNFKTFKDAPHFQRVQWKKLAKVLIWRK